MFHLDFDSFLFLFFFEYNKCDFQPSLHTSKLLFRLISTGGEPEAWLKVP